MSRKFIPVAFIWIIATILLMIFRGWLQDMNVDVFFIMIANVLVFLLTWAGFRIVSSRASASNVHAFMRGVFTSFLLKMFVIVTALFIFISLYKEVNKAAILISMGLYLVYSAVEVFQLMKMVRNQKNE